MAKYYSVCILPNQVKKNFVRVQVSR